MAGLGLEGALGAQSVGHSLEDLFQQRVQIAQAQNAQRHQLEQEALARAENARRDAEMRLASQQRADALRETIRNHQEQQAIREEGQARTNFNAMPAGTELSPESNAQFAKAGIPAEMRPLQPITSAMAPPASIAAPGDAGNGPMPGTIANSPMPSAQRHLRGLTAIEAQAQNDASAQDQLMNAPGTDPQVKKFLQLRKILPKGENAPAELFKGEAPPTAEQDQRRYLDAITKKNQGQPIPPADEAFVKAYERNKTIGPSATSAAADARQKAAEDFQVEQAGRKELTDKVEAPYIDAKSKAETLRNVVEAAKGGNVIAGSVQPLLATLGIVTMEGVKRINNVEVQSVAGAGSLMQRLRGKIGQITEGKPMPEDVQKDLIALADLLEKSAKKKYLEGHKATTTRYGLKNEKPIDDATDTSGTDDLLNRLNQRRSQ